MIFLYLKALHIIFVVTWFAGLFYIVRLFIYHTEAHSRTEPGRSLLIEQFKIMERRLWYGITWPSAVLTLILGSILAWNLRPWSNHPWFLFKLFMVILLFTYHLSCEHILKKLQSNNISYSSGQLRFWNEMATVFLFAIVFSVVLKHHFSIVWGLLLMLLFTTSLFSVVWVFRKLKA